MFIKYGCIRDEKFYDKVKNVMIYKDLEGNYITLPEYLEGKEKKDVYYVSDEVQQAQYVNLFKEQGLNAVILPAMIDNHFISFVEMKEEGVKFRRIDSDISDSLKGEDIKDEEFDKAVTEAFKAQLGKDALKIEIQTLKNSDLPAMMTLSEESRRIQEIYKSYGQQFAGMSGMFNDDYTLVLNRVNPIVKKIPELSADDQKMVCEHIYDLAMISNKPLPADEMVKFIERSNKILTKII